jgi:hypothetical protein
VYLLKGRKKGILMNPLIRLKKTSSAFLVTVVLACFEPESDTASSITLSASQWTSIGYPGGRIDVAAPGGPNVMYVGANVGGIWKTTDWLDATPAWTAVTDLSQVLSLAVHEHDLVVFPGNTNIVLGAASGPGGGVLRSDDAGNTWSYLANSHFDLAEFGAIVVDPNVANAQTMYVAISAGKTDFISGSGLYKSTDGGTTWTDAGSGTFSGFVSDLLEIQENGATVLYAADTAGGLANSGGIYRSDNGGTTWTPTNLPTNANGFFSFRLAGSTAPTEIIYAAIIDNSSPCNSLPCDSQPGAISRYSTSDMGSHWSSLTLPNGPSGQRYRHNLIAVDPADSSTVFVNDDKTESIYKSIHGGPWQLLADAHGNAVGGDPVSATFDQTGVFISTGDVGVFRISAVNGLDQKIGNLIAPEFYSFSLDPSNPRTAYGVVQDGPGTLKYSGSVAWAYRQPSDAGQGESGKIRVDPTNPLRLYYLDPGPADCVSNPTSAARFVHSDNGGIDRTNWQPAITGLTTIMHAQSSCAASPTPSGPVKITDFSSKYSKGYTVIDPNNPQRLLIAVHNSIFETQTGGDPNPAPPFNGNGWRDIGSTLALSGWICKIALAPSDSNTIFLGTEDGRVFKTTNAGNDCSPNCPTWTEVDSGLPLGGQGIMDLQIDPTNPDHDFAVTSPFMGRDDNAPDFSTFSHVWVRNGGAWSSINGNLKRELGGETLAVDWSPVTPKLYLGTLRGMFGSTDLGSTWTRFDSVPRTRVTDLDFVPSLNLIGAGTLGRGAWEILTQSTPPAVTPPANQTSVEGVSQLFNLGSFSDPDGGPWSVDVNWGDGTTHTTFTVNNAGPLPSNNHTYGEEGPYTVTISVTDTLDGQSNSKTFAVNVSDPPVNASGGFTFQTNVGTNTGPQNVATFTDPGGAEPNPADPAGTSADHYSASIDWGDGTNSPGVITPLMPSSPTQVFTFTGNHTFTMESPVDGFNVVTTINHEGFTSMATSTAIVGRAGKVTGGGQIGDRRSFEFEVQPDHNNGFRGHLRYEDNTNNISLTSTSITFVSILSDNKHATFNGTATVNGTSGYTFRVDVEDNGEPGKGVDRFRIRLNGPTSYDSNNFAANGGLLTAGNIEVHRSR